MIKNDKWIREQAEQGMISPFVPQLIRRMGLKDRHPVLSFGLSSYGYDIRLSPKDFKIFKHIPGHVVDPKGFNPDNLEPAQLYHSTQGDFFIIPGHGYGLGVAMDRLKIPANITAIALNKSTYVRCGILLPTTVLEAGWSGYLTLEISNSSPADARIYTNEGILQLLFFEGDPCETSYADRQGKYQNQPEEVTIAKV